MSPGAAYRSIGVVGAGIGGLSGAIYAGQVQYVDPKAFTVINSMLFLCAVVLGGQGNKLGVIAGAVVSGSFQANDQTYLADVLPKLGTGWVGVTQIANDCPDAEIVRLNGIGVRAVRFNVFRGRIDTVDDIVALATRVHSVAGWHSEIYADAAALKPHVAKLSKLPQISIDHLGMTEAGIPTLLELVAAGCKVKASGFGRVKMDVPKALEAVAKQSPNALVFGSDIPSTRAQRAFEPSDIDLVEKVLGGELAKKVYWDNPLALYRVKTTVAG